jgi:hypothetical protein
LLGVLMVFMCLWAVKTPAVTEYPRNTRGNLCFIQTDLFTINLMFIECLLLARFLF